MHMLILLFLTGSDLKLQLDRQILLQILFKKTMFSTLYIRFEVFRPLNVPLDRIIVL